MANHFVKASFVLTVTEAEAEVLRQIACLRRARVGVTRT